MTKTRHDTVRMTRKLSNWDSKVHTKRKFSR